MCQSKTSPAGMGKVTTMTADTEFPDSYEVLTGEFVPSGALDLKMPKQSDCWVPAIGRASWYR